MKTINENLKSLKENNHQIEKEYFELRIEQEYSLSSFKKKQSIEKTKLVKQLKKLPGVSKLRIHNAMSMMKKISYKSINDKTEETFELILNSMEKSFKRHYEIAENEIKHYLSENFRMQYELKQFRKNKKQIFETFKNKAKSHGIDVSMLNLAYIEFKNTISYIKNENISLDEYNLKVSKYNYLNQIAQHFIISEYNVLIQQKIKENEENKNKKKEQEIYLKTLNEMFGCQTKKEVVNEENFIIDILTNMFDNGDFE